MENSTLVSTRALLLVLENITSNVELNEKPPSKDKTKGAESKKDGFHQCKYPQEGQERLEREVMFCSLCKKHGGTHTMHNIRVQALQQGWNP